MVCEERFDPPDPSWRVPPTHTSHRGLAPGLTAPQMIWSTFMIKENELSHAYAPSSRNQPRTAYFNGYVQCNARKQAFMAMPLDTLHFGPAHSFSCSPAMQESCPVQTSQQCSGRAPSSTKDARAANIGNATIQRLHGEVIKLQSRVPSSTCLFFRRRPKDTQKRTLMAVGPRWAIAKQERPRGAAQSSEDTQLVLQQPGKRGQLRGDHLWSHRQKARGTFIPLLCM